MADVYSTGQQPAKTIPPASSPLDHVREMMGTRGIESLLSSFSSFPQKVCFETQDENEQVILFLRQHPIVNVPWVLLTIVLLVLPSLFVFFPPYASLPGTYQFIVSLGWYLFVFGYVLAKFMSWFFNIYIVTSERVVDVDFSNIFYRRISTARLEEIQDVNVTSAGAFETFFGYGQITIQTAAEVPEFEFESVPHPDVVGKVLNELVDIEHGEGEKGAPNV